MGRSWWSESFLGGTGCGNLRFDPREEVNESGMTVRGEESLGRGKSGCWGGR